MSVTQKAIADRLGVSRQLVTFALNGGGTVSEQKRREILEVAEEMGYRRNELARAMMTGKSRVLGVLAYDSSTEQIATIIAGAIDETAPAGYSTKVVHLPFRGSREELNEVLHRCVSWRLDGIMAVSINSDAIELLEQEMGRSQCPVVYVENSGTIEDATSIDSDIQGGFRAAIEHLISLGHQRICHLSGPSQHALTHERNIVFRQVLEEFGLDSSQAITEAHWSDAALVEKAILSQIAVPNGPTAFICAGDGAAMVVLRTLRNHGYNVPYDFSVIGLGNFNLSSYADPPLTTIAQPFRDMGRLAARRLLRAVEHTEHQNVGIASSQDSIGCTLVVRSSTAPPRQTGP